MRKSDRPLLVSACIALTLALSVRAVEPPKPAEKWVALDAGDFRFVSAVSSRQTLEIARNLLRMRAALARISDLEVHITEPTRVFVFRTQHGFRRHCEAMLHSKCDTFTGLFVEND